ncbi:DegV family protein [Spiroplasma eriocheiris]|uniref:DegV family protein n=1 Tax=Spiroplasma eriocheiris TaxID=315358 RepID=A0A0H3XL22_9MOLU|nr:DegV family protein [Spiroplasma eriocheiris]AHF58216.1 putative DegV family protein [Spiroplasma eriocheiris CCTCC M 207170]AKM54651.1 DegV family protein [Spiroplasma eriocheiris]
MSKKIAILTDSSAGFTEEEIKKYQIHVLPLHIILNGETDILDNEQEVAANNFYEVVRTGITKTSQASTGEVINMYQELLKTHDEIIHYPIAEKLSSQYSTAYMIAQDDEFKEKVNVVRNHTAAYSLKQLVILAKDLADKGMDSKDIIAETTKFENSTLMAMIPGSLDRLSSGGRVKKVLLSLINLLKIKILLQWGENPKKVASSRTINSLVESFIDLLKNFTKKVKLKYELFVLKTSECSAKVWDAIVGVLNEHKINYHVEKLPNVFVAHAGLDTVAFVTIPELNK